MYGIGILSAAAATAALVLVAPPTASAEPAAAAAPTGLAHCPNGLMLVKHNTNIYSGWESIRIIGSVQTGDQVRCDEGYDLGRRYTACGVTNGNAWVRIITNDGTRGWSPQACFSDY